MFLCALLLVNGVVIIFRCVTSPEWYLSTCGLQGKVKSIGVSNYTVEDFGWQVIPFH